jgi:RNA polymerase sigma-70 factor (ECF subfamily)
MDERKRARQQREERWRTWMASAQGGDAAAYEKLLLELLSVVRGFVHRRVNDSAAREDVVQNILIAIHRARHTYRAERPFAPWLYAVARNAVTDHLRARLRRARKEVSMEPSELPEPELETCREPDVSLSPELDRALAELPPAQREAVFLVQVQGLSVAEAAARAGVSKSALKVRAHRGYRALREKLGGRS